MTNIRIGCDPEGFLVDGNGEFVAAYGYVPGDKENPHKLDGGAVQVDGFAVEFNIDPVETADQFHKNIKKVLYQINEMIHSVDKGMSIRWTPIAKFRSTIWNMAPEQCKVLGCDPDFNVSGQMNENPTQKLENNPIRTAAGHIHIGWLDELLEDATIKDHFDMCTDIARGFYRSNLSSYIPHTKEEVERLNYYGHSGSFRPKKYGIELRSPSNIWVAHEESQKLIFDQTRKRFHELTGL
jgi:hypothetical protein